MSTQRWLRPSFGDEFTGTSLGGAWSTRSPEVVPGSRRSCAKGDPAAVRVEGGTVRLSVLVDPDATGPVPDPRPGPPAGARQLRVPPQRPHRDRGPLRVPLRRRGRPRPLPPAPRAARGVLAAARERDVPRRGRQRDRRGRVLRRPPPQGGLATFMHRYEGRRRVSTGGWVRDQASFLGGPRDGWSRGFHVFRWSGVRGCWCSGSTAGRPGRMRRGVSDVDQFPILSLISGRLRAAEDPRATPAPAHLEVDWVRVWETDAPDPS